MLFPSYSKILLIPLMSSPHGPNKVVLDPSCTWIRCTRVSSWYSNGPFNPDLVETFKTNAFNASFNVFVLDQVIGPFGTCNGSLLVFLWWSTSKSITSYISTTTSIDYPATYLVLDVTSSLKYVFPLLIYIIFFDLHVQCTPYNEGLPLTTIHQRWHLMRISSTPSVIMLTTHSRCQLGQLQELGKRSLKKHWMGLYKIYGAKWT